MIDRRPVCRAGVVCACGWCGCFPGAGCGQSWGRGERRQQGGFGVSFTRSALISLELGSCHWFWNTKWWTVWVQRGPFFAHASLFAESEENVARPRPTISPVARRRPAAAGAVLSHFSRSTQPPRYRRLSHTLYPIDRRTGPRGHGAQRTNDSGAARTFRLSCVSSVCTEQRARPHTHANMHP